jgi:hypothetical protein
MPVVLMNVRVAGATLGRRQVRVYVVYTLPHMQSLGVIVIARAISIVWYPVKLRDFFPVEINALGPLNGNVGTSAAVE